MTDRAGAAGAAGAAGVPGQPGGDDPGPQLTIGVAIAVPEPYAEQLQRSRESFGDPMAMHIPAHVTLLPPTPIAAADLGTVREHLAAVSAAGRRFDMRLRGTDTFRPVSPVVFVRVDRGEDDCRRVEAGVRSGVLHRELAFDYHPHVTVAHDLPEPTLDEATRALSAFEAEFGVESITLYRHNGDGRWRVEDEYPLGGGVPGPA